MRAPVDAAVDASASPSPSPTARAGFTGHGGCALQMLRTPFSLWGGRHRCEAFASRDNAPRRNQRVDVAGSLCDQPASTIAASRRGRGSGVQISASRPLNTALRRCFTFPRPRPRPRAMSPERFSDPPATKSRPPAPFGPSGILWAARLRSVRRNASSWGGAPGTGLRAVNKASSACDNDPEECDGRRSSR
jgi:hypothetical protein